MEESRAILRRLERIEALDRAGADAGRLLGELRELLAEAEEWSRKEGGEAGARAAAGLRAALARDMIGE
ncbi:MAG TPA: hypothetical protein VLA22_11085 [Gaiellaceae bacterium]|nr:hypothetical protein [Gaiellaceae bacterium]